MKINPPQRERSQYEVKKRNSRNEDTSRTKSLKRSQYEVNTRRGRSQGWTLIHLIISSCKFGPFSGAPFSGAPSYSSDFWQCYSRKRMTSKEDLSRCYKFFAFFFSMCHKKWKIRDFLCAEWSNSTHTKSAFNWASRCSLNFNPRHMR